MATKKGDFWVNKKGEDVHVGCITDDEKLKDELVEELCGMANKVSASIYDFKDKAFGDVDAFYGLLLEKYKIDGKKNSKKGNLTIENYSGTAKIMISVADRIAFDEKLKMAKIKIDEYLHEVTADASADIQTLITKVFDVDKKGDVNAKKILSLKSYDISHPTWRDAMKIIDDATEIVSSTNYIRFYTRENTEGDYELVPLDIAGV